MGNPVRSGLKITVLVAMMAIAWSCDSDESTLSGHASEEPTLVEVTAVYDPERNLHLFKTNVETMPAGWTTFKLVNASPMVHFIFLDHLPGNRTSKELLTEVSPIFQQASYLIAEGKVEEAYQQFSALPDWFGDIVFRGGPGFLSPGYTSEATLYLEPGNYVMECYIKTSDGTFHWNLGMHADFRVSNELSNAVAPENATIEIFITDEGLTVEGNPAPGDHLVAVHFQEQTPSFVQKDVHLIRLNEGVDIEDVTLWLDSMQAAGIVSTRDNPAPAIFLGGVHEMPAGNTAYFPVSLQPGDYAWISEQPVAQAMYQVFTVGSD